MAPTNQNSDGNLLPNEPTYIVACSGAEARIFLSERRFGSWSQLGVLENPGVTLRDQDRNTDRPGRAFDSFDISQYLSKAHSAGQFKQLVFIAEPTILGFVRRKLSAPLKRALSFEIPKNPADFDVERLKALFK